MHKLLYVSSTKRNFPEAELRAILAKARAKNAALGITGLLLYMDGGFLQVLEGDRESVHSLYGIIARDSRHWDPKILFDEDAPRNFVSWSMGFKLLSERTDDYALVNATKAAIEGLIKPGAARPVLEVLIRTFQLVQGAV